MRVRKSLKLPDATYVDVLQNLNHAGEICCYRSISAQRISFSLSASLGDLATSQFLRAQQWEAELFPSCLRHQGWSWHHPHPNLCISFNWSQIAGICSADCSHPVVTSLASRKSTGTGAGMSHHCAGEHPEQSEVVAVAAELFVSGANAEDGTTKICGKKTS